MKIVITSPVEHDGESLAEGDTADMPETQAQALIDAGIAVAVGRKPRAVKSDDQLAADDALAAEQGQGA